VDLAEIENAVARYTRLARGLLEEGEKYLEPKADVRFQG